MTLKNQKRLKKSSMILPPFLILGQLSKCALSYPGPEGGLPTYFFPAFCQAAKCDTKNLKLGWNIGKRIVYPIMATVFAPRAKTY